MPTEKKQKKANPIEVIGGIAITAVVAVGFPLMYYMGYKHGVDVEYAHLHATVGEAGAYLFEKVSDILKNSKVSELYEF